MKCKKCGTELPDGSGFCFNCGANQNEPKKSGLTAVLVVIVIILAVTIIVGALFLTHVLCIHQWKEHDCTHPQICAICGKTQGRAVGHNFTEMTCTEDSVCTICGETGEKTEGHKWIEATCTEPEKCSVCGEIGGEATGHQWKSTDCSEPSECSVCGKKRKSEHQWIEATCTEPEICAVCGKLGRAVLAHDWIPHSSPKTCSRCGATVGGSSTKKTETTAPATTEQETTKPATTKPVTTEPEKLYSTSFSVYDIAESLGIYTAAHEILVIKDVSADNGTATVSGIDMWGTTAAETINVTGCKKGAVVITGTISTLATDTSSQGDFYFTMTGYAG